MTKYEKWRELSVDVYKIKFKNIKIKDILNYFPAGNDVIEVNTKENENFVIKIERSKMADFESEYKNINILRNKKLYNKIPNIIESGEYLTKKYIVLNKIEGNKLSEIFNQSNESKKEYLTKYGEELAVIHKIDNIYFEKAKQRIINDYPKTTNYKYIPLAIKKYINYLKNNKPLINYNTFIHGDFHYGNLLWNNKNIVSVIDFEYSGCGFKEQDIAWALILRPSQTFMDNKDDIINFLEGYKKIGKYNKESLKWCLINGYCHFYLMNKKNKEYCKKIEDLLDIVEKL